MKCPVCGGDCWRDEVDIGVGVQYGPWHCDGCEKWDAEAISDNWIANTAHGIMCRYGEWQAESEQIAQNDQSSESGDAFLVDKITNYLRERHTQYCTGWTDGR